MNDESIQAEAGIFLNMDMFVHILSSRVIMIIDTKNFGKLEIDDDKIFNFPHGIPGFLELKKFAIISEEPEEGSNKTSPFKWLQSVENKDIAFIIMDVYNIIPNYNPLAGEEDIEELHPLGSNILVYNIVVIPQKIHEMSVNLKAPLVINTDTKIGKQIILKNDEYPIKYHFYEEILKKKNKDGE